MEDIVKRKDFLTLIKNKDLKQNLYFNPDIQTMDWEIEDRSWLSISDNKILIEQDISQIWEKKEYKSIQYFIDFTKKECQNKNISDMEDLIFDYEFNFNNKWELYIQPK